MEQNIKYSIVLVCLNAGKGLEETLKSIINQTYQQYEVIIKDGGSTDGTLETIKEQIEKGVYGAVAEKIHMYEQKDTGIYDAMNQAISYITGDYVLFLNAGDSFYDADVLDKITHGIKEKEQENGAKPDIVYGNMYHKALETVIYPSPVINDFACYRNVPCHQTCFYAKRLFAKRGYDISYNVRADYEHFLWCFYEEHADIQYIPVMTAAYEGGGYSETAENRKRSAQQHREIVVRYMGVAKANKYRMLLLLTLAPLRSKIAESEHLSKIYNAVKTWIYCVKGGLS